MKYYPNFKSLPEASMLALRFFSKTYTSETLSANLGKLKSIIN